MSTDRLKKCNPPTKIPAVSSPEETVLCLLLGVLILLLLIGDEFAQMIMGRGELRRISRSLCYVPLPSWRIIGVARNSVIGV